MNDNNQNNTSSQENINSQNYTYNQQANVDMNNVKTDLYEKNSTISLVLAILSLVLLIVPIVNIVLAIIAIVKAAKIPKEYRNDKASIGMIMGIISTVLSVIVGIIMSILIVGIGVFIFNMAEESVDNNYNIDEYNYNNGEYGNYELFEDFLDGFFDGLHDYNEVIPFLDEEPLEDTEEPKAQNELNEFIDIPSENNDIA